MTSFYFRKDFLNIKANLNLTLCIKCYQKVGKITTFKQSCLFLLHPPDGASYSLNPKLRIASSLKVLNFPTPPRSIQSKMTRRFRRIVGEERKGSSGVGGFRKRDLHSWRSHLAPGRYLGSTSRLWPWSIWFLSVLKQKQSK